MWFCVNGNKNFFERWCKKCTDTNAKLVSVHTDTNLALELLNHKNVSRVAGGCELMSNHSE